LLCKEEGGPTRKRTDIGFKVVVHRSASIMEKGTKKTIVSGKRKNHKMVLCQRTWGGERRKPSEVHLYRKGGKEDTVTREKE